MKRRRDLMRCVLPVYALLLPLLCNCWFDPARVNKRPFKSSFSDVTPSELIERVLEECSTYQISERSIVDHSKQQMFHLLKQPCLVIASGLLVLSSSVGQSSAQTLGSKVDIGERVSCEEVQLEQVTKEGAGGGGTVFSAVRQGGPKDKVVVKVSWATSANSVRHECEVLKYLQKYNVQGVERCIASSLYVPPEEVLTGSSIASSSLIEDYDFFPQKTLSAKATETTGTGTTGGTGNTGDTGRAIYPELSQGKVSEGKASEGEAEKKPTSFLVGLYEEDKEQNDKEQNKRSDKKNESGSENERAMIVLDPYFQSSKPSKSTLQDITETSVKVRAVHNLISTMMEMLSAGAAGSDLQPLMDVDTGATLLIDMTEAEIFSNRKDLNFEDKQIAGSFIGEMFSIITSDQTHSEVLMKEAKATIMDKISQLSGAGDELPASIIAIINAYTE